MTDISYMSITEFREKGFLQEANRLFFHPLGLALEIGTGEDGVEYLSGIWDYRDDEEGMLFFDLSEESSIEKAKNVKEEYQKHVGERMEVLRGNVIQPIGVQMSPKLGTEMYVAEQES